jgi:hypothetical protein
MLLFLRYVALVWIYLMSEINEFISNNERKAICIFQQWKNYVTMERMAEQGSY